jgi:hypothetical protein
MVDDSASGVTSVCDQELNVIGTLKARYRWANTGRITARVSENVDCLSVERWGPVGA